MVVTRIGPDDLVDLHLHSTASDGTWSPHELVRRLQRLGIKVIALTDHDTTAHVEETCLLAEKQGMVCIPGVEINSFFSKRCFHILAYGIAINNGCLQKVLRHNVAAIEQSDRDIVHFVATRGGPVSLAEYDCYIHDPQRGGWKGLSYFIDKGICNDVDDFFRQFPGSLDAGFLAPTHVIDAIKQAGGQAVLAHPGSIGLQRDHAQTLDDILHLFQEFGISGIECFHFSHSEQVSKVCLDWCKKNDLLITGGSDSHGSFVTERTLGVPRITIRQVNLGNLLEL